jgi:AraC family transcriptional activator of pobA
MQDPRTIPRLQTVFLRRPKRDQVMNLDPFLLQYNSVNVLRLEDVFAKTNGVVPPFRQSNHLMLFVKRGKGNRSMGSHRFTIENNSLAVIPRHLIHTAHYTTRPLGYLVCFNAGFLLEQAIPYRLVNSRRVLKPSLLPFMVLRQEEAKEITRIFEKLIEECNGSFEEKKQMIALKLVELLILSDRFFLEKTKTEGAVHRADLLEKFDALLEKNFLNHRGVRFYAETLHTHPNHLNHIVKKASGLTAKQTINNRLITEAKYLLTSTTLTVKEIAYDLGFEDPNYFVSFFKKQQHKTPGRYRRYPV